MTVIPVRFHTVAPPVRCRLVAMRNSSQRSATPRGFGRDGVASAVKLPRYKPRPMQMRLAERLESRNRKRVLEMRKSIIAVVGAALAVPFLTIAPAANAGPCATTDVAACSACLALARAQKSLPAVDACAGPAPNQSIPGQVYQNCAQAGVC